MKTLTITEARKRFGAMLDLVRREPVLITRRNGKGAVIMSAEDYNRMIGITTFEQKSTREAGRRTSSWKWR
jgi:prevent-host-death family protein